MRIIGFGSEVTASFSGGHKVHIAHTAEANETKEVRFTEYGTRHRSAFLVSWCHEKGADEFSLQCVGIEPAINSLGPAFDQIFAPFHLGLAKRQMLTASSDGDWVRDVDVFTLNVDSIEQLKVILPDGIFTFGYWTEGSGSLVRGLEPLSRN